MRGVPRLTDTRSRIKVAALRLFATGGFQQTSLRDIAEQLGITKAALYHHFPSKEALLTELLQPLGEDLETFLMQAAAADRGPREVLQAYYDVCLRHRVLYRWLRSDAQLGHERLDVMRPLLHWRTRLEDILRDGAAGDRVRVVVALGGLQDCVVLLADPPDDAVRTAAVEAALRALSPPPPGAA